MPFSIMYFCNTFHENIDKSHKLFIKYLYRLGLNLNEFNPLNKEAPDLTLDADQREIGGLGLTIVRKNVDKIDYSYENNQNILTIEKIF